MQNPLFCFAKLAFLCGLTALAPMTEAQDSIDKFGLTQGKPNTTFNLEGDDLDFATVAPDRFIWTQSAEIPTEFIEAGLFSSFEQVRIGYDPLERDRYEVRIYRASLFEDRIALAAEYAGLFARAWGKKNFGVLPHTPRFGEVLGGDDASGVLKINRISVFRRGLDLLILRQKFDADRFEGYAPEIAAMVGSLTFAQPDNPVLFDTDLVATALPGGNTGAFQTSFPAHWQRALGPVDQGPRGVYDFWLNAADQQGNLAAMIASIPPPKDWSLPEGETPGYNDVAESAAALASLALENLLPDQPFQLEPVEATRFNDFNGVTYFNALYTFKAQRQEGQDPIKATVLHTIGLDGRVLASVMISPAPSQLFLVGTDMHGNYVQTMQLEAMRAYYGAPQKE